MPPMARGCYAGGIVPASDAAAEPLVRREHRELDPVRYAKPFEDVRQVMFDGFLADREPCGDFLVAASCNDLRDDFELARRQAEVLRRGRRRRRFGDAADVREHFAAEPILA